MTRLLGGELVPLHIALSAIVLQWDLSVARRMTQTRGVPPSVEANATERPSADHAPATLKDGVAVMALGVPPVARIENRFVRAAWPTLKRICRPSGETRGRSTSDVPRVSCVVTSLGGDVVPAACTVQRFE